jgi:hypothetical protein
MAQLHTLTGSLAFCRCDGVLGHLSLLLLPGKRKSIPSLASVGSLLQSLLQTRNPPGKAGISTGAQGRPGCGPA